MLGKTWARCSWTSASMVALLLAAQPYHVLAAGSGPDAATPPASTLGEIVVTAEKRASTVQKTPISVTAVTGADLQNRGLENAQAAITAVPGIAVASAGPGQAQYEIRGLTSTGGQSPTIGFYLNETSITPPASATTGKSEIDPDVYDLQRIEVLRGPQGTLYGSSSLGGTVKLVTNPPDFSGFYGSAQSKLSGTEGGGLNYSEKAMINLPIVDDKIALRIVGGYTHNSGWIDEVVIPNFPLPNADGSRGDVLADTPSVVHRGVNDENLAGARIALLIKPTEALTITPAIFYQHTSQGGMNAYDDPPGLPHLAHYEPFDIAEPYSDEFTVYSLTGNYAFPGVTLTSITSYWLRNTRQIQDDTEQLSETLGLTTYSAAAGGLGPAWGYEHDNTSQFSQEVRLASNGSGRLQWLVGGYFSKYSDGFVLGNDVPGLATAAGGVFGTTNFAHVLAPLHLKEEAGFAHLTYEAIPSLKLEVGGRYFAYQTGFTETATGLAYGPTPIVNVTSASASGFNPMATVSWSPTSNVMLYATASKGFREGAGNPVIPTTSATPLGPQCEADLQAIGLTSAPLAYGPDSVWNYEAGEKARLFGGRLILNSDAFYIVWSKVQQPVGLACGLAFTANGPNAVVKGGETELQAKLLPGLTLSQSVGYADAAFSESYLPAGVVKGQGLYDSPRWTLSTNLRFEQPIGRYTFIVEAENSYQSATQDVSYQVNFVPSRDLTNLRIGLETPKWSAYAFANNVFNVHAPLENMNLLIITGPNFNRIATNQPLTAGIELDANF